MQSNPNSHFETVISINHKGVIIKSSFHHTAAGFAGEAVLKLLVQGFNLSERQLLNAIVQLSQRRQPKISLLSIDEGESADIVMIDAADPQAKKWASNQPWLQRKVVIWVDAPDAPGRTVVQRPIQWSALPMLLARVLEQTPMNTGGAPATASGHGSVLVVDDSVAIRAQLRSMLEPRGLTVTDVDNAEDAINAATASPYDCIMMDVLMPGIDGYEACRHIKANTYGGNRPAIVMLTSKSSPFDRIRGKMAGCDAYLIKPIDPDHLHEVMSRYTAKPGDIPAFRHGELRSHSMLRSLYPTT